jgi:hypothetical protein
VLRAQRSSILLGITTGVLFAAACSSSSTPSTFGSGGGSEGGATDAPSMETGSFGGGEGGSGNFMCGAAMCSRYEWCLYIVSDAGAQMSATCIPYGACGACNCLEQMVSTAQCAGDTVSCTPQPPLIVSCVPGGGSMMPGDSGTGD